MVKKQFILFMISLLFLFAIVVYGKNGRDSKKQTYFGLYTNLSTQHNYYVYTNEQKWGKEGPDTFFKEKYYDLSVFKDNTSEFDFFYRKFKAESVFIAGGFWKTEKIIIGLTVGKVLTAKFKIPLIKVLLPIDFSAGPYLSFDLKNKYDFVSGNQDLNVTNQKDPIFGFGIYTNIRFRIKFSQIKKYPSLTAGFKHFIPFNDFEYNPEKKTVSYRLERKFVYIGISF